VAYIENCNVSKIEQNYAKKGLSHAGIGAGIVGKP